MFELIGNNIDQRTATIVAQNYFNFISNGQVANLNLSFTKKLDDGSPLYFAFNNLNNQGFITRKSAIGYAKSCNSNISICFEWKFQCREYAFFNRIMVANLCAGVGIYKEKQYCP